MSENIGKEITTNIIYPVLVIDLILTVIMICLKLTNHFPYSWWWVFSLVIGLATIVIFVTLFSSIAILINLWNEHKR